MSYGVGTVDGRRETNLRLGEIRCYPRVAASKGGTEKKVVCRRDMQLHFPCREDATVRVLEPDCLALSLS